MSQRIFVTLVSNDPFSKLDDPSTSTSFTQGMNAPLELQGQRDEWEVALASLSISGCSPGLSGALYFACDAAEASSRLGSSTSNFMQTLPSNVSATGAVDFINEAADLVVWRPVSQLRFDKINLVVQDESGALVQATGATIATLCFRHQSLA